MCKERLLFITLVVVLSSLLGAGKLFAQEESEGLREGDAVVIGHTIGYQGRAGCDIALEQVGGSEVVGLHTVWKATATAECGADPVYKFSLKRPGENTYTMARDYARRPTAETLESKLRNRWTWTPMVEGDYQVLVTVKPHYWSDEEERVEFESNAWNVPVPSAGLLDVPRTSQHNQVAIYTTADKPCSTLQVEFKLYGDDTDPWTRTNALPCGGGTSKSFFVAGLRAGHTYEMHWVDDAGNTGPQRLFGAGSPPANVAISETTHDSDADPILRGYTDGISDTSRSLHWNGFNRGAWSQNNLIGTPMVKTLDHVVVWYWHLNTQAPELTEPTPYRMERGILSVPARDSNSPSNTINAAFTVYREVELPGTPGWEVSAQALTWRSPFRVWGFHHDARKLGHANTLLVTYTARCKLPDDPSDPGDEPDDLGNLEATCPASGGNPNRTKLWLGDGLLLVSRNGDVLWAWNGFDHLSTARPPRYGTSYPICTPPLGGECPILAAEEYMHSNAIAVASGAPFCGSESSCLVLLSSRYQDLVSAIWFNDGSGNGAILWKLGDPADMGGDFTCKLADGFTDCPVTDPPSTEDLDPAPAQVGPWFSHQHAINIFDNGNLLLLDNGNKRCRDAQEDGNALLCQQSGIRSRGQEWQLTFTPLGEPDKAIRVHNFRLPKYSEGLGSAQKLPGENYVFDLGNVRNQAANQPRVSYVVEVGYSAGNPVRTYTYLGRKPIRDDNPNEGGQNYRAYRFGSLYEDSP